MSTESAKALRQGVRLGEQQEVRLNWEKRPHHIGLVG